MTTHEPLTDADLDRIEAEANAATPGPWMTTPDYEDPVIYVEADIDGGMFICGMDSYREDDAHFIASARTNVPALVAEVRRLKRALTDALEGLEEMRPYVDSYFAEKWHHDGYIIRARIALNGSALASAGDAGREGA